VVADKRAEDAIIMALTLSSPAAPLDGHASDDAASHIPRANRWPSAVGRCAS